MPAIELDGLTKRFGDVAALRGVDMTVEDGDVFGFLGPNGAGKTTTIDILLDFVRPTAGSAEVLGMDAREDSEAIRERLGVLPDGYDLYDRLTGRQHLEFVAEAKRADPDVEALLDRVGLDPEDADRKAGGYSRGMQQRLALAMALVGEPDLLILDEPSSGLDPNGARLMRRIVREENERGATVFFSSHILGQVEAVCDRVAILQDGEIVAEDSVEGLRAATDTGTTLVVNVAPGEAERAADAARKLDVVDGATVEGDDLVVSCDGDAKMDVLTAIEDAGVDVEDFETREASLEDLFAAYTEDGEGPGADAEPADAAPEGGDAR
ncbi:ABC transporter ATP-binding protein [Halosimplex aquaticum]|uniref:ABC transporter ATP-binding protein n=1 Tax=Halosimplex aquaticum TaxID=3026162 RepID=A0ABD5XYS1_9EURY|nr:ABC transporter ATP-binding protein [Halosimplex aquaticum]